jgi:hypothetical protein
MKNLVFAAVTAIAGAAAATTHAENKRTLDRAARTVVSDGTADAAAYKPSPESGGGAALLNALLAEWDEADFSPPSKPSQYRVYGRNGFVTSGPGYNALVSLIRSAIADSRAGRDRDAATKAAEARSLLASSNLRKG